MASCVRKKTGKIKPVRDFDVYYDTTIAYACDKDYMRDRNKAISASTTYKVQPLFDNMFSDTKPRLNLIPKTISKEAQEFINNNVSQPSNALSRSVILGSRRSFFFKQPIIQKSNSVHIDLTKKSEDLAPTKEMSLEGPTSKQTQTDYRDSETQTTPWAHDIIALQGLQLLQLGWLKVDQYNLPGKTEIELIERFWQRKAWESIIPKTQLINTAERLALTEAMARNETAACDAYLEEINTRRLQLSAKKISIDLRDNMNQLNCRLYRFAELVKENQSGTVAYLRHKLKRNVRQLSKKYRSNTFEKTQQKPCQTAFDSLIRQPGLKSMLKQFLNPLEGMELLERKALSSPAITKPIRLHTPKVKNQYCKRNISYLEKGCVSTKGVETSSKLVLPQYKYEYEFFETPSIVESELRVEEDEFYFSLLNQAIQDQCAPGKTQYGE